MRELADRKADDCSSTVHRRRSRRLTDADDRSSVKRVVSSLSAFLVVYRLGVWEEMKTRCGGCSDHAEFLGFVHVQAGFNRPFCECNLVSSEQALIVPFCER